jgi:hypothetical protein
MKLIYSTIFIVLFVCSIFAGNIGIGIKGGMSIHEMHLASYSPDVIPTTTSNYRIGPTLSLFCEIINNKFIGQQIGFGFFQSGGNLNVIEVNELGIENGNGNNIIKLDYLYLSYSMKFRYKLQYLSPYLSLGIQYDYLLNYDDIYISSKNISYIMHNFKYSELNKSNITPIIGIGILYRVNKSDLFFEYLPYFHLLPFYHHDKTIDSFGSKCTTNGHVINLGIKYEM